MAKKTVPSGGAALRILLGAVLLLLAAAGFHLGVNYLKYQTNLFQVREVRIVGNRYLRSETLQKMIQVKEGTPLFRVDRSRLAARILQNKYVRGVSVQVLLPATLLISVQERQPVLLLADGSLYMVDESGIILKKLPGMPVEGLPLVTGVTVEQLLANRTPLLQVLKLVEKIKEVDPELLNLVSEIHTGPDEWPVLYLVQGGARVELGGANYYQRLYLLSEFLHTQKARRQLKKIKRIDLTFNNKVIVEYKS